LTRNRDGDANALLQALHQARPDLAIRATLRLHRQGPEAWESRVLALEGLADTAQRQALQPLQAVLPVLNEPGKLRALQAISQLAWRPRAAKVGCTDSGHDHVGGGSRPIRSLGRSCETRLDDAEARSVSQMIAPFLHDRAPAVRVAAVETLGHVASAWSRGVLRPVARQKPQTSGTTCTSHGCSSDHGLHAAATQALASIERAYDPDS
jgi:hypothetical protein